MVNRLGIWHGSSGRENSDSIKGHQVISSRTNLASNLLVLNLQKKEKNLQDELESVYHHKTRSNVGSRYVDD